MAEKEQTLAGIRLGQTKKEVIALLKAPAGRIIPMPPLELRPDNPASEEVRKAAAIKYGKMQDPPNTLVFTNNLTKEEIAIGETTLVAAGATAPLATGGGSAPMSPGPMTGGAPDGEGESAAITNFVTMPPWAFIVRAIYLNLDQEQLIYKMNETYSLGITFTKKGADLVVTDIVASSFEPLKRFPPKKQPKQPIQVNYLCARLHHAFPVNTAKGLTIGSNYADVLRKQGWAKYSISFVADEIDSKHKGNVDGPVSFYAFTRNAGSDTMAPTPELWEKPDIVPGDFPVRFTDGVIEVINAGFASSMQLIYPDSGISYTLINFKVIRVQVGNGVVPPPPAPVPPDGMGGGGAAPGGMGGGPAPTPTPGGGGAKPTPNDTLF
jgi:hypothetical protein